MSALKSLAQKAKNRLKSVGLNATTAVSTLSTEEVIKKCAVSYKVASYERELKDDKLYPKIKRILDENIDTPSPLKQLIDNKVFQGLSEVEKEKYILDLSRRYNLLREKYLKEHKNLWFESCPYAIISIREFLWVY